MDQVQQPAQNPAPQDEGLMNKFFGFVSRIMIFYFIYNTFFNKSSTPAPTTTATGQVIPPHTCLFGPGQEMVTKMFILLLVFTCFFDIN